MIVKSPPSYTYFPGCSLVATNRAYDRSTRAVAGALGIELVELDDWNCCGATAYMPIHEKRAFVLSGRNLALAASQGRELATVCNACYVVLRKTNKYMKENAELCQQVRRALQAGGLDYDGSVKVRHFLDILINDVGEEAIKARLKRQLRGLKVACYSGCQFSRPFDDVDDAEFPQLMDRLMEWLGAEVVPFPLAAKCCGGMAMTTRPESGMLLSGRILKVARQRGADCIATACPLCQVNLEAYQDEISAALNADCHIPVLYFTQLAGCALGLSARELALSDSLTPVEALLSEKVGV